MYLFEILLKLVLGPLLILILLNELEEGSGCEPAETTNQPTLQENKKTEEATTIYRWGSMCPVAREAWNRESYNNLYRQTQKIRKQLTQVY